MNDYVMISDYMDNERYRASFNKLAMDTFGLDFEDWYQRKLYHNRYIGYSYIYKDEVIANVSINKMNIIVEGKNKKAIQLGTVMTHPDYRNKGLSASLMKHVIEKYEDEYDFIYLFANDEVLNFYPKFGFEKVIETSYELYAAQLKRKEGLIRKLDKEREEDYETIVRLASERQPISQRLGIQDDIWPLLVYCFYEFRENLYYLEDEDVIVIANRKEGILHIYDILSLNTINLDTIIEKIAMPNDRKIEFHFAPEGSKYSISSVSKEMPNNTLFVRTKDTVLKGILFPMTSHT